MSDQEQQNVAEQYVILTQDILCRKDISMLAKLVYARISGFKEFWEGPETTAAFFGKSVKSIRTAKQELERAGLIVCIKNNGHGKCYVVSRLLRSEQLDCPKLGNQIPQNLATYNIKDNININRKKERTFDDVLNEYGINGELRESFINFIKMRKMIKAPLTDKALELAIKTAMKYGSNEEERVAVVNQSIERGWRGIFPIRDNTVSNIINSLDLNNL